MFINNTDRIPVVWDNEGNLGNILFDSTGALLAIDQVLVSIDPNDEKACSLLDRYTQRVEDFLTKVCGVGEVVADASANANANASASASASLALSPIRPIRECIRQETGFDILEAGCTHILHGVRECVTAICQLTPMHLQTIHGRVMGILPDAVLHKSTAMCGMQPNNLGFLERMLAVFQRHKPALLTVDAGAGAGAGATGNIQWPLPAPTAPLIDEQDARAKLLHVIDNTESQ